MYHFYFIPALLSITVSSTKHIYIKYFVLPGDFCLEQGKWLTGAHIQEPQTEE